MYKLIEQKLMTNLKLITDFCFHQSNCLFEKYVIFYTS